MNKEYILKVIAVIGALFIAYLWVGGVWSYNNDDKTSRVNKITGEVQVLRFDEDRRVYFWRSAMEFVPVPAEEEELAAPIAEEAASTSN